MHKNNMFAFCAEFWKLKFLSKIIWSDSSIYITSSAVSSKTKHRYDTSLYGLWWMMTRSVDGNSGDYYINNQHCRLQKIVRASISNTLQKRNCSEELVGVNNHESNIDVIFSMLHTLLKKKKKKIT